MGDCPEHGSTFKQGCKDCTSIAVDEVLKRDGFEESLEGSSLGSPAAKELQAQGTEALRQWAGRHMERHPLWVEFAQKAVIQRRGKVLLVRKSRDDPYQPGKWELPGGRLMVGESPDEALIREVREETGLDIRPGRPLALWSWRLGTARHGQTVIAVARLCEVAEGEVNGENQDPTDFIDFIQWFDRDEILNQDLIPNDRGPIAEALSQLD
jgi:8-oxo-dGTP pyrophosphatase MutT (NUDIX family)